MRVLIYSAILGVVLAGGIAGVKSVSFTGKAVHDRQAAIERAIDGGSKSERH